MKHPLAIRWAQYAEVGPTTEETRKAFYAGAIALLSIASNDPDDVEQVRAECKEFLKEWEMCQKGMIQ